MTTYYQTYWREFPFAVILLLFVFPFPANTQNRDNLQNFEYYLNRAQEDSLSLDTRKTLLIISYELIKHVREDSVKYAMISKIVVASSSLKDSVFFHSIASEGFKLAKNLASPALLADAHWNYGAYYLRESKYNSSYTHYNSAYKLYTAANKNYYAGKMLYNMAYIASQTNDFTGAEILLFRSIKIFESTHSAKQLYLCYNLLGTNADDMEEYGKSLIYYNKAAGLIPNFENSQYYQLENWNNLGVRLTKMEQFTEAVPYFNKALSYKEIITENPSLHAKLLDNHAFCFVSLGKRENVEQPMQMAMALRDSIGDAPGSVINRLRFADYYGKIGDTLKAISFAADALKRARENNLNRDVLHALVMLAALDKTNTVHYLQQHIELDKSLNARDRNLRNKFTAIQYDTDKYILENERLFSQRFWISIGAVVITLLLFLIYLTTRQRAKNKELLFEREQQQYNEDMFLMTLTQKTDLEKGKSEERQRISQELHDGIVSRLFTLRFRWQSVILSGEAKMLEQHKHFLNLLEVLETDIRNLSHELRSIVFLEAENFLDTIETLLKEKSEIGGFTYHFQCTHPEDWEDLSYLAKINLRRLLEEILQNVVKHAKAKKVSITFFRDLNTLHITIADDGKGFSPTQIKKGIGIKNLENRSRKLKGNFDVRSTLGVGTIVSISIPIK
ncbi:MAG: ATP-binding protein [Flavobacteriaceae bacterium]|nr:ATP-binding protein [Flavobacteriaceae bacterium]